MSAVDGGHYGASVARRTKRLWTDEEKRSICLQTTAPAVSVAQVVRRYAANANMVFKWLRDPRYAPETTAAAAFPAFLPVEIIDHVRKDDLIVTSEPTGIERRAGRGGLTPEVGRDRRHRRDDR